jgi:cell division protein FtsI (penicillin-binding protein 3)
MNRDQNSTYYKKKKFWKFAIIFLVPIIGFVAVAGRLFMIQVIDAEEYRKTAKHQHEAQTQIPAHRGNFLDRNGILLASSAQSVSFAVDPQILKDPDDQKEVCQLVSRVTLQPEQDLLAKIQNSNSSFVWLCRGLSLEKSSQFDSMDIPGFIRIREPKRIFMYGQDASQIIGCTDVDNKGITGLEMSWDSLLKGKKGYMPMYRDAKGKLRPSANLPVTAARDGKSLKLTIDIELQRIVEYEINQAAAQNGCESATVAAIDPYTGEILAMASYPGYDPNNYAAFDQNQMKPRAITDVYEPGSTFKVVTAAAALEEKQIKPQDMVDGHGGKLELNGYTIRDDHPLGVVTFRQAFEMSSNIVFSTIANNMSSNIFYKYIRDFGFGLTLGIDFPGEVPGAIKKPAELDEASKRYIGHGYGVSVTPLQVLCTYAAVANGGTLMKPYLVKELIESNGDVSETFEPQKIRRVISEGTAATLRDMLTGVVERGTGVNARIKGLKIAGKTGTSQQYEDTAYSKKNYNASFVGFFPADIPSVAMIVLIDKPKNTIYGGSAAAPIFRNIVQKWISIHPSTKNGNKEIQQSENKTVVMPDLKGVRVQEARSVLSLYNLKLTGEYPENEIIIDQNPKPGFKIAQNSNITISIKQLNKDNKNTDQSIKPVVIGMSLRRAIDVLHNAGFKVRINGKGYVKEQNWEISTKGEKYCLLNCSLR